MNVLHKCIAFEYLSAVFFSLKKHYIESFENTIIYSCMESTSVNMFSGEDLPLPSSFMKKFKPETFVFKFVIHPQIPDIIVTFSKFQIFEQTYILICKHIQTYMLYIWNVLCWWSHSIRKLYNSCCSYYYKKYIYNIYIYIYIYIYIIYIYIYIYIYI